MRKITITILLLSFLFASCGTGKSTSKKEANNSKHQPFINYQKLRKNTIKKIFRLESNKHRLGQVTFYTYLSPYNSYKETTYENKDGKLVFEYESGYYYQSNDTLISQYQYSEIPSYKHPQLIEYSYLYPSDSVKITIQTIGDNQVDSTFFRTSRNTSGKIIKRSEVTKRTYKGKKRTRKFLVTNYFYNKSGNIIKKLSIDKRYRDTVETNYEYLNTQILKCTYKSRRNQSTKNYKRGLLDIEENVYEKNEKVINKYRYNNQGQEVLHQKIKKKKLVYSYKTTYNKKGLKIKYDMVNEKDGTSGIWLYKYDKSGHLKYKIDLYAKE